MRWLLWFPLVIFGLVLGLFLYRLSSPPEETVRSQWIDKPVPEFALPPATDGVKGLSSADLADGEPKILNIFASWCIPCRAEAKQLEALDDAGVTVVAIAIRDTPEDVAKFLGEYGNPFAAIGSDFDNRVQLALGSAGVPESFVIDGDGIIREQVQGVIVEGDVERLVDTVEALK